MLIDDDPVGAFVDYPPVPVASAENGPLSGLTFAVKDLFDVAGYPTGCGNPIKRAESPKQAESAPIVARMLAAGARFIGKTHTDELAFSLNGQNMHYRDPINVRSNGRLTGGSSSGSAAAVAAGLCDFALGSDTGGSVRLPASFCGLFGIRPTLGRVPIDGAMPLAPAFDVPGYFADQASVFTRVAPIFLGEDDRRFVPRRLFRADDAFALMLSAEQGEALAAAQAQVEGYLGRAEPVVLAPEGLHRWFLAFRTIQSAEAWAHHGAWIKARDPKMTPGVRERFEFGRTISPVQLAAAKAERQAIRERLETILGDDAVLMLPTAPTIAPRRDLSLQDLQSFRERALAILCIAGLGGLPQVSIPLASFQTCPLGLSLIGPHGTDRGLVDLAAAIAGTNRPQG
jgi:amidase